MYNANVTSLNNIQVQIANTTQQLATGQRIQNPADDPVGAARASEITQANSANTQYTTNRTAAINTLSLSEGILDGATSLLVDAHTTAITGISGSLSDSSRKGLALDLQNRLNDLLGLANSTDGAGSYLFSGAQGSVKPFVDTAGGVVYQGDDVQRKVQVASARQLSSTDSGADIFMRVRNGNGTFQTAPGTNVITPGPNLGTGIISQGVVTDSSLYTGQSYKVVFTAANSYDIQSVPGGATLTSGAYVSGQAIAYNGVQFDIQGTPAAGDTFDVKPSSNQSVFDTLNKLIQTLNAPLAGATAAVVAANSQALRDGTSALTQGLNAVLGVRATIGSRLNELDSLQATGDQLGLQFKQTLSKLQDTDYNKAATDLAQQKLILQAAQQSFAMVSKLSLFNYM
jgi:flagellar hook-associated protein 3 FlgL